MLFGRSSLRNDYPQRGSGALTWLLSAIVAGFIVEAMFQRLFNTSAFSDWFQLTFHGLQRGHLWQVVSYSFIHPVEDVLSVLAVGLNLLCLFTLGREMESLLGTKRFSLFYLGAVVLGAAGWLAVHFRTGGGLTGAWPAILACLTLFACLNPNQEIKMLLLFVPITIKPKHLAWILFALDFCGLAIWEIRGEASPLRAPHSAHLGGMLAGYLYFRLIHQREWRQPDGPADIELPSWMHKTRKSSAALPGKFKVNLTNREDLKTEVDRILDKINSEGFAALTEEEKHLLDEAHNKLSRH